MNLVGKIREMGPMRVEVGRVLYGNLNFLLFHVGWPNQDNILSCLSTSHTLTGFIGLIKRSTEFTTNSVFPAQKTASQGRASCQFFPLPSTREALVTVSVE